MLTFESASQLRAEPDPRRFWNLAVLMALRDKAERVEVRFTEDGGILYNRVDGRDWELTPVPDDVFPLLKPELRAVCRLVSPERPDVTVRGGTPGGRFEPQEIGWLTYSIGSHLLDLPVRIDPREPWGGVTIDLEHPEEMAGLAADALAAYYGREDTDLDTEPE
ncbi:hypothetical protein [Fimbriiglobus ruber]|uniref:Uncharacterized protein n=1 Tax=Fimbriiglobus ruber TaxID=1908690 RepID=A0A225E528_9BACT|nr:hypothetical protein [Fimbriiglobus ruber]OWK46864.1 hypothetical protein FRUB_00563 [Fimbriiglobus ruber]